MAGRGLFKDITEQRFGRLVVISQSAPTKAQKAQWLCRCDCGGEAIVTTGGLRNGRTRSCGCLKSETGRMTVASAHAAVRLPPGRAALKHVYTQIRWNAPNVRNLEFTITFEEFLEISARNCIYCDAPPGNWARVYRDNKTRVFYSGIDRADNSKGYIAGNCVPCCHPCNMAKHKHTLQQFADWINRVQRRVNIWANGIPANESQTPAFSFSPSS